MSICDLLPGQSAFIHEIHGDIRLAKRLLALGCIEGTEVSLKTVAPLGDPIIVNVRGFNLALRKNDAKHIHIKKV
jgi:ferrous iron transport protein A